MAGPGTRMCSTARLPAPPRPAPRNSAGAPGLREERRPDGPAEVVRGLGAGLRGLVAAQRLDLLEGADRDLALVGLALLGEALRLHAHLGEDLAGGRVV